MTKRDGEDWQEQEAFLRLDPVGSLLARALARPPLDPVPEDFALHVAQAAASRPRDADERMAQLLQYGLLGLLVAIGLGLGQRLMADWWTDWPDDAGMGLPGWLALVLMCLLLSAAPNFLSPRLR